MTDKHPIDALPMPEPTLFAHELLDNGGGVWLGVKKRGVCEKAHTPGETSEEVYEFFTADQLRAERIAAYNLGRESMREEAAKKCNQYPDTTAMVLEKEIRSIKL